METKTENEQTGNIKNLQFLWIIYFIQSFSQNITKDPSYAIYTNKNNKKDIYIKYKFKCLFWLVTCSVKK